MKEDKYKNAIAQMHLTSVFWGLAFGTIMGAVALVVVGKLFQPPYPVIMMLLMFTMSSLYFYKKWFNRLLKKYMDDINQEPEIGSEALGGKG